MASTTKREWWILQLSNTINTPFLLCLSNTSITFWVGAFLLVLRKFLFSFFCISFFQRLNFWEVYNTKWSYTTNNAYINALFCMNFHDCGVTFLWPGTSFNHLRMETRLINKYTVVLIINTSRFSLSNDVKTKFDSPGCILSSYVFRCLL